MYVATIEACGIHNRGGPDFPHLVSAKMRLVLAYNVLKLPVRCGICRIIAFTMSVSGLCRLTSPSGHHTMSSKHYCTSVGTKLIHSVPQASNHLG